MTPVELCEKLGGFANANKLAARVNGKMQYIARLKKGEYEFTDVGKEQAAKANAEASLGLAAPPAKKKKSSKKKVAKKPALS